MSDKKIITVFGATGSQGGSVVDTFFNDPKLKNDWAIRAVTRDLSKDSSVKLAEKGIEVVAADLDDKSSLLKAIAGSYAVFAMTNYWEKMDAKLETQQGKNVADAAKENGVQHFIWSSVYNINKLTKGVLSHVYHFDSKADVEEYVRELNIPSTFFMPGFFMNNLLGGMFKPSPPDNTWTLGLPIPAKSIFPMFHTGDTGKFIKAIVLNREEMLGKDVPAATAYMTGQEIVDGFKRVFPESGKTAQYFEVPEHVFREALKSQGSPDYVIEEVHQNMRLFNEFGYYGGESLDWTHSFVKDHLTTWEEYAKVAPGFSGLK